MKITLRYKNIKINLESKGLEANCVLLLITGAIFETASACHCGSPTLEEWDTEGFKIAPNLKP